MADKANGWSSDDDSANDGDADHKVREAAKKVEQVKMKRRFQKAERKQFAQQSREKDKWDKEYDRGKQRKTNRRTAMRKEGWGKTATMQSGSMSDRF